MKKILLATALTALSFNALAGTGQVGSVGTANTPLTMTEIITNAERFGSQYPSYGNVEKSVLLFGMVAKSVQGRSSCVVSIRKHTDGRYTIADTDAESVAGSASASFEKIQDSMNKSEQALNLKVKLDGLFTIETQAEIVKGKLLYFKQNWYDKLYLLGLTPSMNSITCIVDLSNAKHFND